MDYIKVTGHSNLVRDPSSNSIINTNTSEYLEYVSRKQVKSEDNKKLSSLEEDVSNLKNDINEIKLLLRRLANES
jgi:hypothetical protein